MDKDNSSADMTVLQVSYRVAVRAAEWGTHRLGTPVEMTKDVLTIAASCLVITQVLLQWVAQQGWSSDRFKKAIGKLFRGDSNEDRDQLFKNVTNQAVKAGVEQTRAEQHVVYVVDVLTEEDLDSAFPSSSHS